MSLKKTNIFLILTIILLGGCSQRITDFTIISSKNIDLSGSTKFKRGRDRVVGKDVKHVIILIPTGISNIKQATDRAIEMTPGAVALVDGVVDWHYWWIPYIYGRQWYQVEGTPLIDTNLLKEVTAN
jgi:hypothetical protein